jgi:hypothetical protein
VLVWAFQSAPAQAEKVKGWAARLEVEGQQLQVLISTS